MTTNALPSELQSKYDAAASGTLGAAYTINLAATGQYPKLNITHNQPVTVQCHPDTPLAGIYSAGNQVRGRCTVNNPVFSGGTGTAVDLNDCCADITVVSGLVRSGYTTAYAVQNPNTALASPRRIFFNGLRGTGFSQIGAIVGISCDVSLNETWLDNIVGGYTNGAYLHDRESSNLIARNSIVSRSQGSGWRGGGVSLDTCAAHACIVGFALGKMHQRSRNLIATNCSRAEFVVEQIGALQAEGCAALNDLPAAQLDQGGPGHHNIDFGVDTVDDGRTRDRIDWMGGGCYTKAPESGTNIHAGCNPYNGLWLRNCPQYQQRTGLFMEFALDGVANVINCPQRLSTAFTGTVGTPETFAASRGQTLEQLVMDQGVKVAEVVAYMRESSGL